MKRLILILALVSVGCAPKNVIPENPSAAKAIGADAVVLRLNELQAATIQYCGPAPQCAPGTLDTTLARQIVQTTIDLRATLKAIPDGWKQTVKTAWATQRPRFASITNPAIIAALAAVDVAIGGL